MIDISDIFILCGLIMAGIGLALLSPAIMFIVIGVVIFLMGLFGAVKPKGGD